MPELPEVETSKKGIEPYCVGQTVLNAIVRNHKLRWPVDLNLANKIKNYCVKTVSRRGKYLIIEFENKPESLLIHLGMSGSLRVIDSELAPEKHDHFDLVLSNGKSVRYNDPRRFGCVILNTENHNHSLLKSLGPEPLTDDFNSDYLYQLCRSKKASIKVVIMDSKVVVGVGNIYAQEALFMAKINPAKPASKVSKKKMALLVEAIKQVLAVAIKAGGSSLKDFTQTDGKPGYFQHQFNVYARAGEPCVNCQNPLKQKQLGQRTTTYCSSCQK